MTAESAKHMKDIGFKSVTLRNDERAERVTVMRRRCDDGTFEVRVASSEGEVIVYKGKSRIEGINEYFDCIKRYEDGGFKITKIYNAEVDAK